MCAWPNVLQVIISTGLHALLAAQVGSFPTLTEYASTAVQAVVVKPINITHRRSAITVMPLAPLATVVLLVLPVPQATTQLPIVSAYHALPFLHTMQALKLAFANLALSQKQEPALLSVHLICFNMVIHVSKPVHLAILLYKEYALIAAVGVAVKRGNTFNNHPTAVWHVITPVRLVVKALLASHAPRATTLAQQEFAYYVLSIALTTNSRRAANVRQATNCRGMHAKLSLVQNMSTNLMDSAFRIVPQDTSQTKSENANRVLQLGVPPDLPTSFIG